MWHYAFLGEIKCYRHGGDSGLPSTQPSLVATSICARLM
jgi:hypothetical protein